MKPPTTVSVSIFPSPGIMEIEEKNDGSYKLSGVDGRYVSVLLEALRKPFKIVIPKEMTRGSPGPNNSWTGILGAVQRGEADFGIAAISATEKQMEIVDLSTPYLFARMTFAMKIPSPEPIVHAFLYTFTATLWMSVFLAFLLYPLVYTIISDEKTSYSESFFHLLKCFLGQTFTLKRGSMKDSILMGTWLVFAAIISFSYSEVLMSLKAVPPDGKIYKNFQELSEAVKRGKLHCYIINTARQTFPRNVNQGYLVELEDIISSNQWYIDRHTTPYIKAIKDGHAVIASSYFLQAPFRDGKELFFPEDPLILALGVLPISKTFSYKNKLNQIVSRLAGSGIYNQIMKEEAYKVGLKIQPKIFEPEAIRPIHFEEIYGVFIILFGGYFLSSFVLLVEIIISNIKKSQLQNLSLILHSDK